MILLKINLQVKLAYNLLSVTTKALYQYKSLFDY